MMKPAGGLIISLADQHETGASCCVPVSTLKMMFLDGVESGLMPGHSRILHFDPKAIMSPFLRIMLVLIDSSRGPLIHNPDNLTCIPNSRCYILV